MTRLAFLVDGVQSPALRALNFSPRVERIRTARKGSSSQLRSLLEGLGPAYGSVFTRIDCSLAHGIELLSQSDMFAAEPRGRVIRRDSMAHPERHEIKRYQVLVAGAGTLGDTELYGRALIADGRLAGKYVGPDSMTLVFREPESDQALFTYAYLASPTGFAAIRSTSYGTKILRFRQDLLGSLPVPAVDADVAYRVAANIRRSVELRERYLRELTAAREVVNRLPAMQEASRMCAERSRRATLWKGPLPTLAAWNFASVGEALGYLRRQWPGHLGDVLQADGVFNGPRFARIECDQPHGIDFYSQRDVFLIRPIPRRIARPPISDRMLFVPRNAVLAGSNGQVTDGGLFGRVELASFAAHAGGVTQHILRLLFKPEERLPAFVFLSTLVGQRLLKSTAVGTSIPQMRLDLLRRLPCPEFQPEERTAIARHVTAAEESRIEASAAETAAIKLVETEVLPAWLA